MATVNADLLIRMMRDAEQTLSSAEEVTTQTIVTYLDKRIAVLETVQSELLADLETIERDLQEMLAIRSNTMVVKLHIQNARRALILKD